MVLSRISSIIGRSVALFFLSQRVQSDSSRKTQRIRGTFSNSHTQRAMVERRERSKPPGPTRGRRNRGEWEGRERRERSRWLTHAPQFLLLPQTDIKVCVISDEVKETMRKFRFRKDKNNAAVISKEGREGERGGWVAWVEEGAISSSATFSPPPLAVKINLTDMIIEIDEEMADCSIEEVAAELPEFSPRYVAFSYCHNHGDGRVSYPWSFSIMLRAGSSPSTTWSMQAQRRRSSTQFRSQRLGKVCVCVCVCVCVRKCDDDGAVRICFISLISLPLSLPLSLSGL